MQAAKASSSAERDKLADILSRREFEKVRGESWYDRLKQAAQRWLFNLLQRIVTSSAFPVVGRVVIWALVALAVVAAAFWVVRNYRQSNVYTQFAGSPDVVSAKPWRDWQAEANAAAQAGRWRDAVHLSYWAAISFLEAQGLWRPDLARTPREYLKLLPEGDSHRDPLQELTRSFEKVWYGTRHSDGGYVCRNIGASGATGMPLNLSREDRRLVIIAASLFLVCSLLAIVLTPGESDAQFATTYSTAPRRR